MSYAYNETYLFDAQRNLGEMTEYAHYACDAEIDHVFKCFVISGFADRFGRGDPRVVAGMSGTELYISVMEKCGVSRKWPDALVRYDADAYYWTGYILALFQWRAGLAFRHIFSVIKSEDLFRMFPALHTVSDDRAVDSIEDMYRERTLTSRLQVYRKLAGLTQAGLAEASGVNLRTLQQYEIGDKDIRKASVDKVISLAKVLHCRPEDMVL
ncbi:MAG: helix-turn-helix transcriptional regulator [Lachnospiraceae bacterium]|nr:helix-turn-helix transcriptional regulator [Lachnospiraceae bacterium]